MLQASDIIQRYIRFFEKRKHIQIPNAPLIPENDPTTLFTSSGMQPLVPYLLGEQHPQGKRLVSVQNCFRAGDIDEVGDNRHTTFFRMLGNWSLGDYFKKEQLPWFFEFLTKELSIPAEKLYVTVFTGDETFNIAPDTDSVSIWKNLFKQKNIEAKVGERIFPYGSKKNWWSRSGTPDKMPIGEPGGPDSEVFYDFGSDLKIHEKSLFAKEKCHVNCDCGRYIEIANSVFMQYQKQADGSFKELPKQNVDFGGGLERFLMAVENHQDVFQTSLFLPIIQTIEQETKKEYKTHAKEMRILTDHLIGASFMIINNVTPSNTEQGYILRRLLRRALDGFDVLGGENIYSILECIVEQYKETDPKLLQEYEKIRFTITQESDIYRKTQERAKTYILKKYPSGDELKGTSEITAEDAFILYSTHGLSPTQIKSLGFTFNEQSFAAKMEDHQKLSRHGGAQKFAGGLADHQERTVMGHTATHLLHQALRDVLGNTIHQTGSNITTERLRFDFNFDKKLTEEEIEKVKNIVMEKIKANLPVHFEIMPKADADKLGAIGLFTDTYADKVKIYFIGDTPAYSIEFCGGPHVDFTSVLKQFKIIKQENIGHGQRRIYATVGL